ncbi:Rad21/Rec8-like protein, N-terminal [Ostreococcus tauri]|uniref:Rad21/Rec8-like protein, N-terminal n=1 Tax=Ostreococcus tauri TaxID=70448 RepID=A0A090LY11_OSTTA|nr:Rad21/Rec8-like protein, N-terminal [Ostreococcus tauri]CEF96740.1 Rad21/Rec8-like protein, N-terminal [Ostreococcus tauri]|eukprot:XP_022838270.1 Rad21/Rec8-like protein, N-terminal [Ostreococcus tauri]
MFYSSELLCAKGALGQIWKADRMTRNKTNTLSVTSSCATIMNPPSPLALRLAALLMRGVVALYSRKVRFLYEDCVKALSRLNALTAPVRADRNLLEKPEGGRDARVTNTVAYDGEILARPDFERVHVSQAFDSQAFHTAASEQLESVFDEAYDRYTVRQDDQINLLDFQMPMDEEQARIEEQYEYECAMDNDRDRYGGGRGDLNDDYADFRVARMDDMIDEQMPLVAEDEEPIEHEPIGTQLKRMREQLAMADKMMILPQPKKKRQRTVAMARSCVFVFDHDTRIGSDVFRHWLASTSDIVHDRPDIDVVENVLRCKDTERDFYFHSEGFKVNPAICARSALQLFVVDPAARFAFEQFADEPEIPVPYQSDDEYNANYYDTMYDEYGNVRSTEKMRYAVSAKKSTPGSFTGFFNRDKTTPSSTLLKSGRSSGLGFDSASKIPGMMIPEDPDEAFPLPENYDEILGGSELDFDTLRGAPRRRTTMPSQPSLNETDGANTPAHGTPQPIGKASMNLLQFLSRAVFTAEHQDVEMESVSLTDLCVLNHLNREKVARLFYQTLVLVGADYLTAYQDTDEAFGEITLVPGARFEFNAAD